MGWGYCGLNTTWNIEMGYTIEGICMGEPCEAEIDHGLAFVCGGMHEGGEHGCGRYFCYDHLYMGAPTQLCLECLRRVEEEQPELVL